MRSPLAPPFGVLLLVGAVLCPTGRAQTTHVTANGVSAGDRFGVAVAGAGDVDLDGYDDLIVGANLDDDNGSAAGSARVVSGADGSTIFTFDGDAAADLFGSSVAGAGDVNMDGYPDLIVGAPGDDNNGSSSGMARVFSGLDGSMLYTKDGDSADDEFGTSVAGAGDVDMDGYADFVVGAPGDDNNGADSGSARVFSGFDGSVLYTFDGDAAGDALGTSVGGAGDVDMDGYADVIAGAPDDDNNGSSSGSARVFSGFDGSTLYTFDGDAAGDMLGSAVGGAGDVDGDGYADLIAGAPSEGTNGFLAGSARVWAGVDGSVLYTFYGDSSGHELGSSVAGAGDVDGDGRDDLVVGAPGAGGGLVGSARVLSGLDGSELFRVDGDASFQETGTSVGGAGDVNGDGRADVVVGLPGDSTSGFLAGAALAVGAEPLPLESDVSQIVASVGGTVNFQLRAGAQNAGRWFVLMSSTAGTTPAFVSDRVVLPLNLVGIPNKGFSETLAYVLNETTYPGPPRSRLGSPSRNLLFLLFANSPAASLVDIGSLNGGGMASSQLVVPADPLLAGTTLHFAYLVQKVRIPQSVFASNAVQLDLIP